MRVVKMENRTTDSYETMKRPIKEVQAYECGGRYYRTMGKALRDEFDRLHVMALSMISFTPLRGTKEKSLGIEEVTKNLIEVSDSYLGEESIQKVHATEQSPIKFFSTDCCKTDFEKAREQLIDLLSAIKIYNTSERALEIRAATKALISVMNRHRKESAEA